MTQTSKDLENIKSKLIEQIKLNYSEEKAVEYISNINSMDENQFIEFLKQQGLLKQDGIPNQKNQCIFCSIVFRDIPSTKIGENEKAIAILDLNPVSKGHTLIIPKEHTSSKKEFGREIKELVILISQDLLKTFNPKKINQVYGNIMGHEIINLIPVYSEETIRSKRTKETKESLTKIKNLIKMSRKKEIIPQKKLEKEFKKEHGEINKENTWLPKRIP